MWPATGRPRRDYIAVGVEGGDTIVVSTESLREFREGGGRVHGSVYQETFGICLMTAQTTLYQDLFVYYHPSGLPDGRGACARARYVDVVSLSVKWHRLYDLETLSLIAAWER